MVRKRDPEKITKKQHGYFKMLQPIQTIDTLAQHAKLHCILHVFISDQKLSKHMYMHMYIPLL